MDSLSPRETAVKLMLFYDTERSMGALTIDMESGQERISGAWCGPLRQASPDQMTSSARGRYILPEDTAGTGYRDGGVRNLERMLPSLLVSAREQLPGFLVDVFKTIRCCTNRLISRSQHITLPVLYRRPQRC